MDLGLPGIYYNDVVVCVPRPMDGITISVNGTTIGTATERGLRLHGPVGPVTPVYRASGVIDLRIPWIRPSDVAVVEPPATVQALNRPKPLPTAVEKVVATAAR